MKKIIQKQLYSLLATQWGRALCLLFVVLLLNGCLLSLSSLIESRQVCEVEEVVAAHCTEDVDLVVVWTNYSDPLYHQALQQSQLLFQNSPAVICGDATHNTTCFELPQIAGLKDYDQLKYLLRSVEKNAPWIRRIHLITNGQIPNWLNLANGRLFLVTHSDLFLNSSHLPTFNKAAVESNLHRLPGLANKFVYVDGNYFFGREIFPDDYFTQSRGQKVFLSGNVPLCHEGCTSVMINDGYCDDSCNNTLCDFDGDDCKNGTSSRRRTPAWGRRGPPTQVPSYKPQNYCSRSCPDNWIGDLTCDFTCKNVDCGFDGGDCGVEPIKSGILGLNITEETKNVEIPDKTLSVYFDFTNLIGTGTIVEGSVNNSFFVRTATLTQSKALLVLTLHRDIRTDPISLVKIGILPNTTERSEAGNSSSVIFFEFTLIMDVPPPVVPDISSTHNSNASLAFDISSRNSSLPHLGSSNQTSIKLPNITIPKPSPLPIKILVFKKTYVPPFSRLPIHKPPTITQPTLSHSSNASNITDAISNSTDSIFNTTQNLFTNTSDILSNITASNITLPISDSDSDSLSNSTLEDRVPLNDSIPTHQQEDATNSNLDDVLVEVETVNLNGTRRLLSILEEKPDNNNLMNFQSRKLLDVGSDSLKHIDRIYTKEFGYTQRKLPARIPHIIDKNILFQLQNKFSTLLETTSSHQFSSSRDFQFIFSYYSFLMQQKQEFSMDKAWDVLDVDHDGLLNNNEIHTLGVVLYGPGVSQSQLETLKYSLLYNGTLQTGVTKKAFEDSNEIKGKYASKIRSRNVNKFEVATDDLLVLSLADPPEKINKNVDSLRDRKNRFVLLNLQKNLSDPNLIQAEKVLNEFYESFYPFPSQYELPDGEYNEYLYIDELRSQRAWVTRRNTLIYWGVGALVLMIGMTILQKQMTEFSDCLSDSPLRLE